MALDMLSWMGGAIFTALMLGGTLGYAILGSHIPEPKEPIDDDQQWSKLLNREQ